MQAQLGHSDIRTTLDIYTQITDPEVARMVNQVTNRILHTLRNSGYDSDLLNRALDTLPMDKASHLLRLLES